MFIEGQERQASLNTAAQRLLQLILGCRRSLIQRCPWGKQRQGPHSLWRQRSIYRLITHVFHTRVYPSIHPPLLYYNATRIPYKVPEFGCSYIAKWVGVIVKLISSSYHTRAENSFIYIYIYITHIYHPHISPPALVSKPYSTIFTSIYEHYCVCVCVCVCVFSGH